MHNSWPSPRLLDLCAAFKRRQNVTISIIGGSFSSPGNESWVQQTTDVIKNWFPSVPVRVHNAAHGGSVITYGLVCLEDMVYPGSNLVVVEYNPNALFSCFGTLPEQQPQCVEFELLIRKILRLPSRPAVMLLLMGEPNFHPFSPAWNFQNTPEDGMAVVASYYGVPYLSMRDALYHNQRANISGFSDSETRHNESWLTPSFFFHYNALGNKYVTDVVIHWLWHVLHLHRSHLLNLPDPVDTMKEPSRLPSLWRGSFEPPETAICVHMFNNVPPQLEVILNGWTYAADDPKKRKFGYLIHGNNTGQSLQFSFDAAQLNLTDGFTIYIGYLKTYEGMGSATLTCIGCSCTSVQIDGADPKTKTSTTQFKQHSVRANRTCTISLQPARTNKETDKFKVNAFVVVKSTQLSFNLDGFLPPHNA
jgi:hypothetical protein